MQNQTSVKAGERTLRYNVGTLRGAGLEAKWGRNSAGAPIIFARMPQGDDHAFYAVGRDMWDAMKKEGVFSAFERFTMLGKFFSVPA